MTLAYLDESQIGGTGAGRPYLLGAALFADEARAQTARARLRLLQPQRGRKLHWHEATSAVQHMLVDTVSTMPTDLLVVIRDPDRDERPERARRHCIERMMFDLQALGTRLAVFESRGLADDRRDSDMLSALRARRVVSGAIRVDHVRGHEEPLLWLPDIICGAVGRALGGDRRSHCDSVSKPESAKPGPRNQREVPGSLPQSPR